MKSYVGCLALCGLLDMCNIIIMIARFGKHGLEYQEMTMIFLSVFFWGTNVYWVGFVMLLYIKFPDYISKYLLDVFMAIGIQTNERILKAG